HAAARTAPGTRHARAAPGAPSPFAPPAAASSPFAPPAAAPPRAPAAFPDAVVTRCQNCNILLGARTATCPNGHRLCGDCSVICRSCNQVLCLVCNTYPCKTCSPT
ncbi:MAG: hypothetical protein JNK64_07225, partial [Myxococcales bacterium]|nr:hypothetical protein [Myxococcales bacterium]